MSDSSDSATDSLEEEEDKYSRVMLIVDLIVKMVNLMVKNYKKVKVFLYKEYQSFCFYSIRN